MNRRWQAGAGILEGAALAGVPDILWEQRGELCANGVTRDAGCPAEDFEPDLGGTGGPGELYTGGTYVPVALTSQRRPRGVSSAKVRCRFMLEIPRFLEILVQAPTPPHSFHPTLCVLAPGSLHNRARSVLSSVAFVPVSVQGGKLKTGLRFCSAPSLGSEGGLAGKEGGCSVT